MARWLHRSEASTAPVDPMLKRCDVLVRITTLCYHTSDDKPGQSFCEASPTPLSVVTEPAKPGAPGFV